MTFDYSRAITELKAGRVVRRSDWPPSLGIQSVYTGNGKETVILVLKGELLIPYTPSVDDAVFEEWEILSH